MHWGIINHVHTFSEQNILYLYLQKNTEVIVEYAELKFLKMTVGKFSDYCLDEISYANASHSFTSMSTLETM